jgi:hypothetical protein
MRAETLHLSIYYLDIVFSKMEIESAIMFLVALVCVKIAEIFNERS